MKASCRLTIDCNTSEEAEKILRSIKVDDYTFVKSRRVDCTIEATINSNSLSSLLHTLDDYLSCFSVAKSVVNKK
jgi:tRNA threonylcarbamoyladenosine modification (KEOPS) complex  Pcc1 subunit